MPQLTLRLGCRAPVHPYQGLDFPLRWAVLLRADLGPAGLTVYKLL